MNRLQEFNIAFAGLKVGKHSYSMAVNDDFFACFPESQISKALLQLSLELEKSNSMLQFDFTITGEVELECDRCLEMYRQPLMVHRRLMVKFGEEFAEQSDEILVIPSGESHFDISHFVYEFIHLELPWRHVHPEREGGASGCDQEIIQKLKKYSDRKQDGSGNTDARWDALNSLRSTS